jgi:hypothetical protein
VRRFVAFLLGVAAGLALVGVLRRRKVPESGWEPSDPRAEELARRLADSRSAGEHAGLEAEGPEPESSVGEELDDARRRVHDEARDAVEEMRRSGGAPPPA